MQQALRLSTGRLDHDRVTTLFRLLPPALTTLTLDDVAVVPEQGHRLLASAPQGLERVVLGSATFTRTSQGWSGQGLAFS